MNELVQVPVRVVATALTATGPDIDAGLVLTEDSTTTYGVREDHATGAWIAGVLDAFGVPAWEELRGRTAYALRQGAAGPVVGFEHLPTEPGGRFEFPDTAAEPVTDTPSAERPTS